MFLYQVEEERDTAAEEFLCFHPSLQHKLACEFYLLFWDYTGLHIVISTANLRLATQLAEAGSAHTEAQILADLAKMTDYMERAQDFANKQAQYA